MRTSKSRVGRPLGVKPDALFDYAHLFYGDFRTLLEGGLRPYLDKNELGHLTAELQKEEFPIIPGDKARIEQQAAEEIRTGRLEEAKRAARMAELEEQQRSTDRQFFVRHVAPEKAMKEVKVPGDSYVFKQLLEAKSADAVREICRDAPNWPIRFGSHFPHYLERYSQEFVDAKIDPRFPRSTRPSTPLKQIWFLSRALAGAVFGEATRTAINKIGSKRPEQLFEESRAAKPMRKRARKKS